jgi:hypothetical protein
MAVGRRVPKTLNPWPHCVTDNDRVFTNPPLRQYIRAVPNRCVMRVGDVDVT